MNLDCLEFKHLIIVQRVKQSSMKSESQFLVPSTVSSLASKSISDTKKAYQKLAAGVCLIYLFSIKSLLLLLLALWSLRDNSHHDVYNSSPHGSIARL